MALKFDLSALSQSTKITKAVLSLYAYENAIGHEKTLKNGKKSLFQFSAAWTEDKITWDNAPKFASKSITTSSVSETKVWETYDVTSEIKKIVENGGQNHGFLLKFDSNSYGVLYRSSEYGTVAERPKLIITCEDTEAPTVSIISPSEGQTFKMGTSCKIAWEATDLFGVVSRAIYFTSGNGTWDLADSGTATNGTGIFTFKFPSVESSKCKIKVNTYDAAGNLGVKESGTFAIIDPSSIIPDKWHTSTLFLNPAYANTVTVTNVQGKVLASFKLENSASFARINHSLSPGLNIVTISNAVNQLVVKKLISVK